MSAKNFIKQNLALVAGIALPVLLMAGFFVAAGLPHDLADPPRHDMVFAVRDYQRARDVPVTVDLVVKDGVLRARYAARETPAYDGWKKLYLYEAGKQAVRVLPLDYPLDLPAKGEVREETVEATRHMKLDTSLKAPDGYELDLQGHHHGGIMDDLFFGHGGAHGPRLRKGASSVRLSTAEGGPLYAGSVEFLGWVVP